MARQGKKLSKPQPLAKAVRPRSTSSPINNDEAPLLPHERVVSTPSPYDRPNVTPKPNNSAAPSLRRASSAPSCLQTTPSASAAVSEKFQGILARVPSKKLQKKQRLGDGRRDNDDEFAVVPAATPTMVKDAHLALGFGPRELMMVAADYNVPSTPSLHPDAAAGAAPTAIDDDDEDEDEEYYDDWLPPPIAEVQHPVNVIYLRNREIIGRGALMPELKRWLCCKCGRRTHYESPICSCLDCCHNRCEDYCTTLEPA